MDGQTKRQRIQLATGVIWAEVEPVGETSRRHDVSADEDGGEPQSIAIVRDAIKGLAEVVHEALESVGPNKATVEFGLEVGVESGKLTALWVKGTGKANLKITLSWEKK
jgi:hypothetical protein